VLSNLACHSSCAAEDGFGRCECGELAVTNDVSPADGGVSAGRKRNSTRAGSPTGYE